MTQNKDGILQIRISSELRKSFHKCLQEDLQEDGKAREASQFLRDVIGLYVRSRQLEPEDRAIVDSMASALARVLRRLNRGNDI